MLSLAPALQPGGDPTALYPQARAGGEALGGWVVITTADPTRPQIVNTAVPPGDRLPKRAPPEVLNAANRRDVLLGAGLGLPPDVLATVRDGSWRVVARSVDPDPYIGTIETDWMAAKAAGDRGVFEGTGLDNQPKRFAGSWRVVVGMPLDSVAAVVTRPVEVVLIVGAGFVALLLMAIGLVWLGRRDDESRLEFS